MRANTSIEVRYINCCDLRSVFNRAHVRIRTYMYTNIIRCMMIIENNKAGQLPKNFVSFFCEMLFVHDNTTRDEQDIESEWFPHALLLMVFVIAHFVDVDVAINKIGTFLCVADFLA